MEIGKTRTITLKKLGRPYYLVPIGDIHLGNEACAVDRLKEMIDWVRSRDNVLWVGMGDISEYIGYKDSRFDPSVIDKAMSICDLGKLGAELSKRAGELFRPIASKCVGMIYGNHEDCYELMTQAQNLHGDLCASLGVQDLGYSCFQIIEFRHGKKKCQYLIRAHHGAGWAQAEGAVQTRLVKFVNQSTADITLVGHLHRRNTTQQIQLHFDGKRIVEKVKFGCMTGTYLKTYEAGVTTYGEKRGYDPTPLGSHKIPLLPFQERTIGEIIL